MATSQNYLRKSSQGFTLIELLVVVLILGALAAIVIPRFMNVEGMAEKSAASTNIGQVNAIMDSHYALSKMVPDGLDLIAGSTLTPPPQTTVMTTGFNQNQVDALKAIGLVNVYQSGGDTIAITTNTTKGLQINSGVKAFVGGTWQDIGGCYVFGLGSHLIPHRGLENDSLATIQKPGTFPGLPDTAYRNYLVVVRLSETGTSTQAEYLGCIDPLFGNG